MAASLLALGVCLAGAPGFAQAPPRPGRDFATAPTADSLRFSKEPVPNASPRSSSGTGLAPLHYSKPAGAPQSGVNQLALQPKESLPSVQNTPAWRGGDDDTYYVQLEPPGPQRLFRLESEQRLKERMRQEAMQRPSQDRVEFPTYKPLTDQPFMSRAWPCQTCWVEPSYLCYGKLLFEELNSERYGWDLGFAGPFVSTAYFYKDFLLLPYNLLSTPCCCCDSSAGHCLPGDPVPYLLYPPGLSATGGIAEAVVVIGLLGVFP